MKPCVVWVLLLIAAFPLSAQIREGTAVFVPPVSGIGSAPRDNAAFTELLKTEVKKRGYILTETPDAADYFLKGTLVPPDTRGEDGPPDEGKFLFSVDLQDTDGITLYSQDVYYLNMEEADIHIPAAVDRILYPVYRDEIAEDASAADATAGNATADETTATDAIAGDAAAAELIGEKASAEYISIYVPPLSGSGSTPEDNAAFTELLKRELEAWNIVPAQTPEEADYILKGTLVPPDTEDGSSPGGGKYLLSLDLQDEDGVTLASRDIYYHDREEAAIHIPPALHYMLSPLLDLYPASGDGDKSGGHGIAEPFDADAWRNKQWYFGAGVFWSPRLYHGTNLSAHLLNFGIGLSAEYHFLKFASEKLEFLKYLSVGTGLELVPDWVVASPKNGDHYRNVILQIPLSVGMVLKPGEKYIHQPYAGILFNIPFFPDTAPALLSWKTGFQYGFKAGPGIFCADAGFSMDFGTSGLSVNRPNDTRRYRRYMMYLGVMYKYGI